MAISNEAKDLTKRVYKSFGTDTDILFGIPPCFRGAVEAIIQCVLNEKNDRFVDDAETYCRESGWSEPE